MERTINKIHNALQLDGRVETPDTTEVTVVLSDSRGVLLAYGATVPSDAEAGYAKGCIFIDTNAAAGAVMLANEGDADECDFNTSLVSGDISAVNTASGSGLSGGASSGAADLQVVVDDATVEIATNTIQVKDGGIDTTQLAADSVDGTKLADDAVDSEHIAAGAIDPEHLASNAVETAKIADANVTPAKTIIVEARTATADGLTTGVISAGKTHVTVTSANATDIITLPAPVVGQTIQINVGANGFKLKSSDPSTIAINGGTGASVVSTIAADSTLFMTCVSATAWKGYFLHADSDVAKVAAAA